LRYGLPKAPILLFLPLLISGLIYIQLGQNTPGQFFKIFIGFFASVLFYRFVVESFEFDVERLYKLYIKGAVIVSVIGLFQMVSYFVGFTPGYNFSWILNKWGLSPGGIGIRLNSIFSEPAYFAGVIGPAFFVAVNNLVSKNKYYLTRRQSLIIVVAYLLTFSSLGILAIFITTFLLLINYGFVRYAIVIGPLLFVGYNYTYENVPEFRERIDGTFNVFGGIEDVRDLNDIHGSSFVLYNNFHVATENFRKNPLFGTGLGSHELAFEKYSLTNIRGVIDIDFNRADANSMFLRLMSETGLYGTLFFIWFILFLYIPRSRAVQDKYWIISNSLLIVITVYLMRQGHYFINGFPLFLWLYYYTWKLNKAERVEEQEDESAVDTGISFLPK
jgi:hypothetical protein